jgi:hypothetical protein
MASATYRLFRQAILTRQQVICSYQGRYRELCPHVLGYKNGEEKVLAFQFGGESNSTLPPRGEWRCLVLAHVREARRRDGRWYSGNRHTRSQACIDIVDVDVNVPPPRP